MLSIEEKIFGLSLIWKEAEYNFSFWSRLNGLEWDNEYNKALSEVISAESDIQYYLILSRFISLLRDGHTDVYFPHQVYTDAGQLRICLTNIDGKCVICNSDSSLNIEQYTEVIEINNMPVWNYIKKKIYPFCWHEKEDSSFGHINQLLPIVEYKKEIIFTTTKNKFTIKCVDSDINWKHSFKFKPKEQLKNIFNSKTHSISITDDNIAVINIPSFNYCVLQNEFYKNLTLIKDCKAIMIDVRNNGGGNSGFADAVAQAFINGEFTYSCDKKMIHIGSYKSWGRFMDLSKADLSNSWNKKVYDICKKQYFEKLTESKEIKECPLTLNQPVAILENEFTASSAEDFLINFDNIGRAIIVGTPSYGSTGQPLIFDLPGGGSARICTMWCTYPDGREFINIGVKPHVYAQMSLDDYKKGYDRVFDKGLQVLRGKIIS